MQLLASCQGCSAEGHQWQWEVGSSGRGGRGEGGGHRREMQLLMSEERRCIRDF